MIKYVNKIIEKLLETTYTDSIDSIIRCMDFSINKKIYIESIKTITQKFLLWLFLLFSIIHKYDKFLITLFIVLCLINIFRFITSTFIFLFIKNKLNSLNSKGE